jgi:flagellar biosynthesis anti-sigma factor FlgM
MKIDGFKAEGIYESFNSQAAQQSAASKNPQKAGDRADGDKVEISSGATVMSEAKSLAKQAADLILPVDRETKIAQLRELINNGQYNVHSREVASSIVKGRLFDALA